MKTIFKSMCSAFLMYSKIPVPQVAWSEENKRYAFCFFPLIGIVIAIVFWGWYKLCVLAGIGRSLYAAGGILIPVLLTGGIHLDGYLDVCDAKSSYGTRERLLEIMSDSHIGAFAVIHLAMFIVIQYGVMTQIVTSQQVLLAMFSFPASRSLSGLAAITFKSAKSDGTLQSFARPAERTITLFVLGAVLAVCIIGTVLVGGIGAIIVIMAGAGTFLYYRLFSYKRFGGITGDLAGYFLQIFELTVLAAIVAGSYLACLF